ncbi:MAG TPA: hypothetical protein VLJ62_05785 [Burkholderiaceae bacterium]|nr:hypothetical protein [Burkholderiaceae bacterium]
MRATARETPREQAAPAAWLPARDPVVQQGQQALGRGLADAELFVTQPVQRDLAAIGSEVEQARGLRSLHQSSGVGRAADDQGVDRLILGHHFHAGIVLQRLDHDRPQHAGDVVQRHGDLQGCHHGVPRGSMVGQSTVAGAARAGSSVTRIHGERGSSSCHNRIQFPPAAGGRLRRIGVPERPAASGTWRTTPRRGSKLNLRGLCSPPAFDGTLRGIGTSPTPCKDD